MRKTKKEVNFSPGGKRSLRRWKDMNLLKVDTLFYLVLRKLHQWSLSKNWCKISGVGLLQVKYKEHSWYTIYYQFGFPPPSLPSIHPSTQELRRHRSSELMKVLAQFLSRSYTLVRKSVLQFQVGKMLWRSIKSKRKRLKMRGGNVFYIMGQEELSVQVLFKQWLTWRN